MDEFQQRVLAAVEKPKRNRLLAVINSPFFLWVMSVLLLSIGGSYITNHKQCRDDAEKAIERRNRLSQESLVRLNAVAVRVTGAENLQEATHELSTLILPQPVAPDRDTPSSIFKDLSQISYAEMQKEFEALTGRITYAALPDPSLAKYRQKSTKTLRGEKMFQEPQALSEDDKKRSSPDESQLLKLLQRNMSLFAAERGIENALDAFAYYFRPDCSVINVAALTFGYRPPIIFAEISPLYSTSDDGRRIIKGAIQEIEQKRNELDSEFRNVIPRP